MVKVTLLSCACNSGPGLNVTLPILRSEALSRSPGSLSFFAPTSMDSVPSWPSSTRCPLASAEAMITCSDSHTAFTSACFTVHRSCVVAAMSSMSSFFCGMRVAPMPHASASTFLPILRRRMAWQRITGASSSSTSFVLGFLFIAYCFMVLCSYDLGQTETSPVKRFLLGSITLFRA